MPISIGDLAAGRRTFTLDTDFGGVRVTYRPYEMTPAREAELARLGDSTLEDYEDEGRNTAETEAGLTKLIAQFCTVVEAWDLVGPLSDRTTGEVIVEAGEPVPVNERTMRYVSSYFMVQVLNGIAADARPKKTRRPD
jgi:hypothetical protein